MTSADLALLCSPFSLADMAQQTVAVRAKRIEVIAILAARGMSAYEIGGALRMDGASIRRTATRVGIEIREPEAERYKPSTSLAYRISRMLPKGRERGEALSEGAHCSQPLVPVPALIPDDRPDRFRGEGRRLALWFGGKEVAIVLGVERRRWDCARLEGCEMRWIMENGGAMGRCPEACAGYEQGGGKR